MSGVRIHSKSNSKKQRRTALEPLLNLRESEIILLRHIQKTDSGTTIHELAAGVDFEPLQFASTLSKLSMDGFIQVRGGACRKLFVEAGQAITEASEANEPSSVGWKKHLMELAKREALVRVTQPNLLKVATAPVRLTKQAEVALAQQQVATRAAQKAEAA